MSEDSKDINIKIVSWFTIPLNISHKYFCKHLRKFTIIVIVKTCNNGNLLSLS